MKKNFTVLIRKSKLEYVAVCLELNLTARGSDLAEVEKNLKDAIDVYLKEIKRNPEIVISPISTEEIIEFLRDTEPSWLKKENNFYPLEVHEVPSYV